MTDKRARVPGPDHSITIERNPARVVVSVAGRVIADTREALTLREASYAPVHYVPRKDVDMEALERTAHATYCPYKGDCAYYSISIGGERSINAVWTYEAPYPAVAEIRGRLAFYRERVDAIEERPVVTIESSHGRSLMSQGTEAQNKAIVLEAFDTLFNKRDYGAAERFWSPHYVQHSAHIEPGRDGLFNLIKSMPPTFKHEHEQIVAEGEFVIVHSRFSGFGQAKNWIVADFVRLVDGILVEHWDVVEDEASPAESKSGRPMFGDRFPA